MILAVNSCMRRTLNFSSPQSLFLKQHYSQYSSQNEKKLISLLKSCTDPSQVHQIHGSMLKSGLDRVPFTLSKLLASSISDTDHASSIFNRVPNPNLFMCTTMLRGFSVSDDPKRALLLFSRVRVLGFVLDQFCFIPTLKACARSRATKFGLGIHGLIVRSGHGLFINVKNTLLHFYCACGKIGDAHQLFDGSPRKIDLVSWNTLMGGYLHASQPAMVIELFRQMVETGLKFGSSTVLTILSASGELQNHVGGRSLHGHCIKVGFFCDLNMVTATIDMYAKTGHTDLGHKLFNEVPIKDVVLWNCLIDGYARSGQLEESLALLQLMKMERIKPNSSTLAGLLSSCAASGSLGVGQCINDYVEREQLVLDAVLGTALVDMYSKCGFLQKAIDVFNRTVIKDVKSWTAMISAYGVHGEAENAITVFYRMEEEGIIPNEITFLAVLSACSHGGLVKEATACYERMVRAYGFAPRIEHYGCMIDLLGRAGLLEEAYRLIKSLPFHGDVTAWRALLAACRVYGNIKLGERVKRDLVEMYDEHPTDLLLLSSTYAIAGMLPDLRRMEEEKKEEMATDGGYCSVEIKEEKIVKEPGCSIINMDDLLCGGLALGYA